MDGVIGHDSLPACPRRLRARGRGPDFSGQGTPAQPTRWRRWSAGRTRTRPGRTRGLPRGARRCAFDGSVVADVIVASHAGIAGTLTQSLTYATTIHLVARSGIAPTGW